MFFHLPESVQEALVVDMDTGQLRQFLACLDADEAADVLGFIVFLGLAKLVLGV